MTAVKRGIGCALLASLLLFGSAGCASKAQTGAGVGTMTGAAIGGLAAGSWAGAGIGAAAGLVGGYMVGNEMDKADAKK